MFHLVVTTTRLTLHSTQVNYTCLAVPTYRTGSMMFGCLIARLNGGLSSAQELETEITLYMHTILAYDLVTRFWHYLADRCLQWYHLTNTITNSSCTVGVLGTWDMSPVLATFGFSTRRPMRGFGCEEKSHLQASDHTD